MSLKIRLKNFGILKHAEFALGDLTLICGENNTGKTYTSLCTARFLAMLWRGLIDFGVSRYPNPDVCLQMGSIKIGLAQYVERANQMLAEVCERYTDQLDEVGFCSN